MGLSDTEAINILFISTIIIIFITAIFMEGGLRNFLKSFIKTTLMFCLFGVSVTLTFLWISFCFGSIIIGVVLLFVCPQCLLAPMGLLTFGISVLDEWIEVK